MKTKNNDSKNKSINKKKHFIILFSFLIIFLAVLSIIILQNINIPINSKGSENLVLASDNSASNIDSFDSEDLLVNNNNIYVSPIGKDSNDGSIDYPFVTIQHAINCASPGTTIVLRDGIYYENITINNSGNQENGYIKIIPYKKEKPIIDGSKTPSDSESNWLMKIENKSYICIEGIEFRNLNLDYAIGLFISNGSQHVIIKNNSFHDINTIKLNSNDFGSANAISVLSYEDALVNSDITLDGNNIYDCTLGFSEALVLSGNTMDFKVINNNISNVSNIGIDIAGHYGEYSGDPANNQARNGIIEGNIVSGCLSDYGSDAASGIYIDGAKSLIVSSNIVTGCDYGITVGCEPVGKKATDIDLIANIVYKNNKSGISVGGYNNEVGTVENCRIVLNKTYKNNILGKSCHSEICINVCKNIDISSNIFYGTQTKKPDFSKDKLFYPILYNVLPAEGISLSNNIYYSEAGYKNTYFRWNDKEYLGFNEYQKSTLQDFSSYFQNPNYINPEDGKI